jgi:hypothetical protein
MKKLSQNIARCDQRTQPGFKQRLRSIVKIYLKGKNVTLQGEAQFGYDTLCWHLNLFRETNASYCDNHKKRNDGAGGIYSYHFELSRS